jgi:hypothetical protein
MQVVLLADGSKWKVYAVCSPNGDCPVLDLVLELDRKRAAKVLSDLREHVPESSSSDWAAGKFSEPLTNTEGLFEFRWPTTKGGTPRVIWFYQPGKIIVCSHGLNKKGVLANDVIEKAAAVKTSFERATRDASLVVVKYNDFVEQE